MRRLTTLLVALVLALAAVACGGDDGGDDATGTTTTTTSDGASPEAPSPDDEADDGADDEEVVDPYDGYTSDVYEDPAAWICRPDLDDDACRDLDVTRIGADGTREVEEREPAEDPPVDCFYVYPTVSQDPGTNSDMEVAPGDAEELTVVAQAAQYARSCRVFAPIYRQVTLQALGSGSFGDGREVAYGDVLDAWKTYVSQYSDGRGVIVIGHSQGAGILRQLVADEVDGVDGVQDRLVAAHLFGTSVQAPEGEVVGGDLSEVPACTAPDEVGCVVTYSSYPAGSPPVDDALFAGADEEAGTRALCVDPVGLLGREHGSAVAPVAAPLIGGIDGVGEVETRFVALPDAVDVSCTTDGAFDYLAVAPADPDEPRPVESLVAETIGPTWGLHLVDMTHVQDDLVELAAQQGAAYAEG